MPWQHLTEISLIHDWQMSAPVQGEIFRISHKSSDDTNKEYLKAVISSAFLDNGVNLLSPKRLTYREEREIFLFYFPAGIALQQLAFRRLDNANVDWIIQAEVFVSESSEENFSNYIIARFGELMPLFNESVVNVAVEGAKLTSTPEDKALVANVPTLIADLNPSRQGLIIFNPLNQDVYLGINLDTNNQLQGRIAKIRKDGLYELPITAQGCYIGKVYALCTTNGIVSVSEFVPVV